MLKEIKTKYEHYFVDEQNRTHGEHKLFHENGTLCIHGFYFNGLKEGAYMQYRNNGKLVIQKNFLKNELHGEYKAYHDNGQLHVHAFYSHDLLHGEYIVYASNGKHFAKTFFYQGNDLKVDPDTLTEQDILYIMMSGRLPQRD